MLGVVLWEGGRGSLSLVRFGRCMGGRRRRAIRRLADSGRGWWRRKGRRRREGLWAVMRAPLRFVTSEGGFSARPCSPRQRGRGQSPRRIHPLRAAARLIAGTMRGTAPLGACPRRPPAQARLIAGTMRGATCRRPLLRGRGGETLARRMMMLFRVLCRRGACFSTFSCIRLRSR